MHSDVRRCVFLLILYCKCACVCVFTCIHEKRGGESSSGSGQVKFWGDVTVSLVPLSVPGEYSYTLLPSLSKPKAISTHRVITPYPGKRTHDITLRIYSHHRQYTVLWNSTLVQSPQDLNWINNNPCRVLVGHFLIWVLCIQSERYESSWISALPVVLIHQFLILCFDLRRLPLVLACLESPSHHKRPGPSVSSRSLYEQEKRFHGSNCSQSLW